MITQVFGFLAYVCIGLWAGMQVHIDEKYAREDWRGLTAYLGGKVESNPRIWFSDHESFVPFLYYLQSEIQVLDYIEPPTCQSPCWWIIRQPYTATHAFAQAISVPERPWLPEIPEECQVINRWESPTGLALWKVQCRELDQRDAAFGLIFSRN